MKEEFHSQISNVSGLIEYLKRYDFWTFDDSTNDSIYVFDGENNLATISRKSGEITIYDRREQGIVSERLKNRLQKFFEPV